MIYRLGRMSDEEHAGPLLPSKPGREGHLNKQQLSNSSSTN
jgi:hypothetical protein